MEKVVLQNGTEQVKFFDSNYSRFQTDTRELAIQLAHSTNLNKIIDDFKNGDTDLRDVGKLNLKLRKYLLESHHKSTDNLINSDDGRRVVDYTVGNLHDRLINGPFDQPLGHNFFYKAEGFVNAGLSWAIDLDNYLKSIINAGISDITHSSLNLDSKTELLIRISSSSDPRLRAKLAVYLAGSSREGERFLEAHYGHLIKQMKTNSYTLTEGIAQKTNLKLSMFERAVQQLNLTEFGSFDHMVRLVTTDDTGRLGDYLPGTLRIELTLDGNTRRPNFHSEDRARGIIAHELHHSISAQSTSDVCRVGLQCNGQGLEANEGMTELLGQLTQRDNNRLVLLSDGSVPIQPVSYGKFVSAMFVLYLQFQNNQNAHFATLFNAYHGDIRNAPELENSLDYYYLVLSRYYQ